MSVVIY